MTWLGREKGKKKAMRLFRVFFDFDPRVANSGDNEERMILEDSAIERFLGIYNKTRTFCSGWCCGNPRRITGTLTMQEKIAEVNGKEQVEEWQRSDGPKILKR